LGSTWVLRRPIKITRITGHLTYQDFTCPVSALIRWDEKAGLHRDAISSQ